jgi:S-adenosylmethionine synthetase
MLAKLKKDLVSILIQESLLKNAHAHLFNDAQYHINPTGKFVIEDPTEIQDLQEENHCRYLRRKRSSRWWCFL